MPDGRPCRVRLARRLHRASRPISRSTATAPAGSSAATTAPARSSAAPAAGATQNAGLPVSSTGSSTGNGDPSRPSSRWRSPRGSTSTRPTSPRGSLAAPLKARTLRGYTETLDRAVDEIGHADLREIGKTELDRFIDSYGDDASDATLRRALRELSACLTAAVDEGYAERNPVPAVRQEARPRARRRRQGPVHRWRAAEAVGCAFGPHTRTARPRRAAADPVYLAPVPRRCRDRRAGLASCSRSTGTTSR